MTFYSSHTARGIALLMAVSFSPSHTVAQGYVSPFSSGSSVPNVNVSPGYGYGYGGGGTNSQVYPYSPYGNGMQSNNGPGGGYGSYGSQGAPQGSMQAIQPGGAPAAAPAPVAGVNARDGTSSANGANPARTTGNSPSAAARGSLRDGDILHGSATAVSGSTITVEGVTISLHGVMSPSVDALCSGSSNTTWKCGEKAKTILSAILSSGPVRCTYSSAAGVPSGQCLIGFDDVSKLAVQEGAAMSNDESYRWYSNEAMNDRRGIWARAGR